MPDFDSDPWGSTDEDHETGYVAVRAATASIAAAKAWLVGDGLEEVLDPDSSRRVVPDGLEPRYLTVSIPVDRSSRRVLAACRTVAVFALVLWP